MTNQKTNGENVLPMKKRRAFKRNVVSKYIFVYSILAYFLILFSVFYVWVNFNSILMAFKFYKLDGSNRWVGFDNFSSFFEKIFAEGSIVQISLFNSLKLYIISLVISMPLYIFFAYVLFKKCLGHSGMRMLVMLPSILSGFIVCLMFKSFVSKGIPNLLKNSFDVAMPPNFFEDERLAFGTTVFYCIWVSFSTNLIVYPNAMKEIDEGILEAAKVDGVCNMFQELFYIILPLIYPTITTFLITGLAGILSTDGSLVTLYYEKAPTEVYNMGYYYWKLVKGAGTNYTSYPELAAGGLIMTAIVAPLTLFVRWLLNRLDPTENL